MLPSLALPPDVIAPEAAVLEGGEDKAPAICRGQYPTERCSKPGQPRLLPGYTPGSAIRLGYAAVLPLIIAAAGAGLAARGVPPAPPCDDVRDVQYGRRREAAEDADHDRPGDPVDEARREK